MGLLSMMMEIRTMNESMAKFMSLVEVDALIAGRQEQQQEQTVDPTQHAACAAQHVPNTKPISSHWKTLGHKHSENLVISMMQLNQDSIEFCL